MNFPEAIVKGLLWFRKSVFFRVFYVTIIALMVAAITLYGFYLGCLSILFAAVVMLAIPYWLKERNIRNLALNGIVIFALATLIFGALFAQALSGSDPLPVGASGFNTSLTNATVTPGRGPPGAYYNFTATLTAQPPANVSQYAIWVNLTTVDGVRTPTAMAAVDRTDSNLSDGKRYYANLSVGDAIYGFWFAVAKDNGGSISWLESPGQWGPITASYGTFFGLSLYVGVISLTLPIAGYFLILMLYWWTNRAKMERQRLGMAVETESTDSGFMCTNCGADVPADAKNCPKCGAVFEEAASRSPPRGPGPAEAGEGPHAKR